MLAKLKRPKGARIAQGEWVVLESTPSAGVLSQFGDFPEGTFGCFVFLMGKKVDPATLVLNKRGERLDQVLTPEATRCESGVPVVFCCDGDALAKVPPEGTIEAVFRSIGLASYGSQSEGWKAGGLQLCVAAFPGQENDCVLADVDGLYALLKRFSASGHEAALHVKDDLKALAGPDKFEERVQRFNEAAGGDEEVLDPEGKPTERPNTKKDLMTFPRFEELAASEGGVTLVDVRRLFHDMFGCDTRCGLDGWTYDMTVGSPSYGRRTEKEFLCPNFRVKDIRGLSLFHFVPQEE